MKPGTRLVQPGTRFVQPGGTRLVHPGGTPFVHPGGTPFVQPGGTRFVQPGGTGLVQNGGTGFVHGRTGLVKPRTGFVNCRRAPGAGFVMTICALPIESTTAATPTVEIIALVFINSLMIKLSDALHRGAGTEPLPNAGKTNMRRVEFETSVRLHYNQSAGQGETQTVRNLLLMRLRLRRFRSTEDCGSDQSLLVGRARKRDWLIREVARVTVLSSEAIRILYPSVDAKPMQHRPVLDGPNLRRTSRGRRSDG